jgi:peptide/nickel transport system substrate-binding protein
MERSELKVAIRFAVWLIVLAVLGVAVGVVPRPLEAAPEGTITVGTTEPLQLLDPALTVFLNDYATFHINVYDTLVYRDKQGKLVPHLATSWRLVSPTVWELKLRSGVKFHNGESFNAQAVKFTVERYLEQGKRRDPYIATAFAGAEVMDDLTVRITTHKPDGAFLDRLWYMPIVPPAYVKQVGDEEFQKKPVGTGPFHLMEFVKGDRHVLEANANYFKGAPKIKRVVFKVLPENSTRLAALKAGEIDIAQQLPPDAQPEIAAHANLRLSAASTPRIIYLLMFPKTPDGDGAPLADRRVRLALNHAIDIDKIIKFVLNGQAERIATAVPPGTWGHEPELKPYPYDPERAKKLLAEAGFPNGFEIGFAVPNGGNPIKPAEVGQAAAADLAKVGIRTKYKVVESGTYRGMKLGYKTPALFMWNWIGYDADYILWGNVHSKSPWFHFAGWRDEVDRLVDEERTTVDDAARLKIFWRLQQILYEEAPYVPLYRQNDVFGVSKRIDWEAASGGLVALWNVTITGK